MLEDKVNPNKKYFFSKEKFDLLTNPISGEPHNYRSVTIQDKEVYFTDSFEVGKERWTHEDSVFLGEARRDDEIHSEKRKLKESDLPKIARDVKELTGISVVEEKEMKKETLAEKLSRAKEKASLIMQSRGKGKEKDRDDMSL